MPDAPLPLPNAVPPSWLPLAAAALMGAAGVAFGALAAHRPGAAGLATASSFLLFHAPAVLALAPFAARSRPIRLAQAGLILGPALFSGTVAATILLETEISPSPAPLGGSLTILAWLLAAAGFLANLRLTRRG